MIPCEEKTLLVKRGSWDGRGDASVGNIFKFLDSNLPAELWICYNYQWLSTHVKPAPQNHYKYSRCGLKVCLLDEVFENSFRFLESQKENEIENIICLAVLENKF